MSEASTLQCKSLEESLASSSNSKQMLSLEDDVSHTQDGKRNLSGSMEELSRLGERSFLLSKDSDSSVAHAELERFLETRLGSLAALIGEHADKPAKEIEAALDTIARVEKLVQFVGGRDSYSLEQEFNLMNDVVNQIKDDVKHLAARIEELAQMNEASRLQCNSLDESLPSLSNSKSFLSLEDDVTHIQQEVLNLTGSVEESVKLSERSLSMSNELSIWVKAFLETRLKSLAELMGDDADEHAKEIEAALETIERVEELAEIAGRTVIR